MRRTTVLKIVFLGILAGLSPRVARAQSGTDIGVQAVVKRPGCDAVFAQILVYNKSPRTYYKVHVQYELQNDEFGPQFCPPATTCLTKSDTDLTLSPCAGSNFCNAITVFLPNCPTCFNGTRCGHLNQFCANFSLIDVKVTDYSDDGSHWTPIDATLGEVCRKDDENPFYNGPSCPQGSLCYDTISDDACGDFQDSCN